MNGGKESLTPEQCVAKAAEQRDNKIAYGKGFKATQKVLRRYECKTCDLAFEEQGLLNQHNLTKKHVDKVRGVLTKVTKPSSLRFLAYNCRKSAINRS